MIACGIVFYAFYTRFVIEAPKKEYPLAQNAKEAQRQDLDYLSLYINLDRSFDTEEKRAAFNKSIKEVEKQLPVSKSQFEMAIAKMMAIADNTHTNVHPGSRARRFNAIPLRFYWFEESLHVVMTKDAQKDLLGAKIIRINGHTPMDLLEKIKPWYGGANTRLKFFSPLYFMSPELLNAIGYGLGKDAIAIEYIDVEGKIASRTIKTDEASKKNSSYWPPNWLNPSKRTLENGWNALPVNHRVALPFQHLEKNVWHEFINNGLYVKLNENANTEHLNINSYLKNITNEFQKKTLEFVILDVRFNPGGDYNLARSFIKAMDKKLDENQPFYIVTGNGTFSAGIMTAAIAKHTLGNKAKIIGEPVGDRLQFWSDGGSVMRLPNSKIPLRIWTAYQDWENGCSDWSKCFWITIFDGVAVNNLDPDVKSSLRFSDFMKGEDTALNTIFNR